jgi:hypothetical protein
MANLMLVEQWKTETVKRVVQDVIACAKEAEELITQHGRSEFLINRNGCASKWINKWSSFYRNLRYNIKDDSTLSESGVAEIVTAVNHKFKILQTKVENKIGKIVEIQPLGGDDYFFIGAFGRCVVEVILAGGYNIQRLHTRWIIK